ncbi:MAG TPA: APC family permease [Anaerolineales bacterium]
MEHPPYDHKPEHSNGLLNRVANYNPQRTWRTWLIGRPLPSADAPHQTIGKAIGLAVFAGDALSSVAYAPPEMLLVLAAAGMAAFGYAFPIALAVTVLLAIVTISYQQTIYAYPGGGGAYIVARDNLGEIPAQIAGVALQIDYLLLAAVAASSAAAQIVSAYPFLLPYRVAIAVGLIAVIMLANLRGAKESGIVFAIPTYIFMATTFLVIVVGFIRYFTGTLGVVLDPPAMEMIHPAQPLTFFLILKAFASGTTALTGVESISNGVTAFKEPRSHNAAITMIWMSSILGVLFLGITYLLGVIGAVPSETETVISQLARTVFGGRGISYLSIVAGTTIILVLAANTAFAAFPRLAAIQAGDGFLPRQLTFRGSRLVYSRGIIALGVVASLLVFGSQASVTALIPIWAIGVFLSFTLSQLGMARRWWKIGHLPKGEEVRERGSTLRYEPAWETKLIVNGFGALCTAVVTIVFAVAKFREIAWIIVILMPLMVAGLFAIHRHYRNLAQDLSLEMYGQPPPSKRHRVIMPVSAVHQGTLEALDYALSLSDDVTVVHVSIDPAETEKLRQKWSLWGKGTRLVMIESPYRTFLEPLLDYVNELCAILQPNERLTIVVPQFVPKHWWHNLLHTQTAFWLRFVLLNQRGVVITEVPYQVR